jgi:hypothetical protein
MKRKACNIVSTNPGLQNDAKNILPIAEAFQLLISKKMVEETYTETNKKVQAVFSSSSDKQKEN